MSDDSIYDRANRVLEAARGYANHDDCTTCIEMIRMANHGRNA